MNMIITAAQFARKWHGGQTRKYNGLPYITHPARVAAMLTMHKKATEDIVCAAWLHDTVEDCGVSPEEVEHVFGYYIGKLVRELTNVYTKEAFQHMNRAERKKAENERIANILPESKLIKLADRLDNLRDMQGAELGYKKKYANESEELLKVLRDTDNYLESEIEACIRCLKS